VNADGESALSVAAKGNLPAVKLLVTSGRIDMRISGARALAVAIRRGERPIVDLLVRDPALDVNLACAFGAPPPVPIDKSNMYLGISRRPMSSPLVEAMSSRRQQFLMQIMNHPSFQPSRAEMTEAIFLSIDKEASPIFEGAIGDILTIRSEWGESLLSAALEIGNMDLAAKLQSHPDFDITKQAPERCLDAAVQLKELRELQFLSQFPEIDLNSPLPYGLNGFPDIASRSRPKRFVVKGHDAVLMDGAKIISAIGSRFLAMLFRSDLVDRNQRGKHGETVVFHVEPMYMKDCNFDMNATDRHGNTVVICAAISGLESYFPGLRMLKCDFRAVNDIGQKAGDIIGDRARRILVKWQNRVKGPDRR
jgi:hypothetical protein